MGTSQEPHHVIIVRYGEINLKGKNRAFFERALVENIRKNLKYHSIQFKRIERARNRVYIFAEDYCRSLKAVFGISSWSLASVFPYHPSNHQHLEQQCITLMECAIQRDPSIQSFRVTTQRLDDSIKVNSQEFSKQLGATLFNRFKKKVSLTKPDINVQLELKSGKGYLFTETNSGFDGLPVGTEGTVAVLFRKGEEQSSVLITLLMMKRGCHCVLLTEQNANIRPKDTALLASYLNAAPTFISFERDTLNELIIPHKCLALVVPDQFPELTSNMYSHEFNGCILRPLITYTDQDIEDQLKQFHIPTPEVLP